MSCWVYSQGQLKDVSSSYFQCEGSQNCCANGDVCLDRHMCWSAPNAKNKVDFYPAGCSDKDFPSPNCPKWCSNEIQPSLAQFNSNNNTWTCCGTNNIGKPSCNPATGENFGGNGPNDPFSDSFYQNYINNLGKLAIGAIVGIVIGGIIFLGLIGLALFCCCCSRRARDRRNRGKFVPLGNGRDMQADQVVWNSNVHDGHELHEGPMGGYGAPPHGPGMHGAPQYTVQGFR